MYYFLSARDSVWVSLMDVCLSRLLNANILSRKSTQTYVQDQSVLQYYTTAPKSSSHSEHAQFESPVIANKAQNHLLAD